MHRTERTRTVKAFKERGTQVLINVTLFSEGTDLPAVDSVFIARPTLSEILFRQMVGRGMRGRCSRGQAHATSSRSMIPSAGWSTACSGRRSTNSVQR